MVSPEGIVPTRDEPKASRGAPEGFRVRPIRAHARTGEPHRNRTHRRRPVPFLDSKSALDRPRSLTGACHGTAPPELRAREVRTREPTATLASSRDEL